MNPSPPADDGAGPMPAWAADGVRHHILLRALRGQRHDVLGPLSAARMGLATLKRRLAARPVDADAATELVAGLADQMVAAVAAVALMRVWDGPQTGTQPLQRLLPACADLLRTDASLRGHRLTVVQTPQEAVPGATDHAVATPAAHYALLGWLMHHLDDCAQPANLALTLQAGALELRRALRHQDGATPGPDPVLQPPTGDQPRSIDAGALALLLRDLGWRQETLPDQRWRLHWPPA